MKLDEILKLDNTIVIRRVFEDITKSRCCICFKRDENDNVYEDYNCYRITLYNPIIDYDLMANFEYRIIKVYVKKNL